MNKTELINAIAEGSGLTKTDAAKALNATIAAIAGAVKEGDKVSVVGFGTFAPAERPARTCKNPRTGESMEVPAKKVVKFKAGSDLAKVSKEIFSSGQPSNKTKALKDHLRSFDDNKYN